MDRKIINVLVKVQKDSFPNVINLMAKSYPMNTTQFYLDKEQIKDLKIHIDDCVTAISILKKYKN